MKNKLQSCCHLFKHGILTNWHTVIAVVTASDSEKNNNTIYQPAFW